MHCPPNRGEDYYLQMLLNYQKGCICYDDIRIINDKVYVTYKEACHALGLLDDDNEYIDAINEATNWAS